MATPRKGESREQYLARRKDYDKQYERRRNVQARGRGYTSRAQERRYREKIKTELKLPELPKPRMKPLEFPAIPTSAPMPIVDLTAKKMSEEEEKLAAIIKAMGFDLKDIARYEGDWQEFLKNIREQYGRKG